MNQQNWNWVPERHERGRAIFLSNTGWPRKVANMVCTWHAISIRKYIYSSRSQMFCVSYTRDGCCSHARRSTRQYHACHVSLWLLRAFEIWSDGWPWSYSFVRHSRDSYTACTVWYICNKLTGGKFLIVHALYALFASCSPIECRWWYYWSM
jgi:hypothetical protein